MIVSPQEWETARQQLLVQEKELTRARDALAAERRGDWPLSRERDRGEPGMRRLSRRDEPGMRRLSRRACASGASVREHARGQDQQRRPTQGAQRAERECESASSSGDPGNVCR